MTKVFPRLPMGQKVLSVPTQLRAPGGWGGDLWAALGQRAACSCLFQLCNIDGVLSGRAA